MLIDLILDRKGGESYNPKALYNYLMGFDIESYQSISRAMDCGSEYEVKKALIQYVLNGFYDLEIINYILCVNWL